MKLSGNNRLTRWALFLQGYKFTINYKKGILLTSADALSRVPWDEMNETKDQIEQIPSKSENDLADRLTIDFETYDDQNEMMIGVITTSNSTLPTMDEIQSAIKECPDFAKIYKYVKEGVLPPNDDLARRIVAESQDYVLQDEILYHLYMPRTKRIDRALATIKQVCVPTPYRERVAEELHSKNAHIGFDRLYSTVRSRYFWPQMYTFLHKFVMTCLDCQKCKRQIHPNQTPLGAIPVASPATRWNVDFHGPFVESEGKKYVLVFICQTSGWPEVVATSDVSATTVVRCLYDCIVSRFGTPRGITLQSDNGSGFVAQLTKLCCETFGVKQCFTSAYNPQANVRVESWADILHKSLRVMCEKQTDWAKHLQAVAFSYRASATTNSLLSPFEIMFGRSMEFPLDISIGASEKLFSSPEAYYAEIGPKLEIMHQIAQQNVSENAERHRNRENKNAKLPELKPGDKVLLYDPTTKKGQCAKLKVRYQGPYLIVKSHAGHTFMLQDLKTGKTLKRAVHARRLRPLREREHYLHDEGARSKTVYETMIDTVTIKIVLEDITTVDVGVVVCFVDKQLNPVGETSERLFKEGGSDIIESLLSAKRNNDEGESKLIVIAETGRLAKIDRLVCCVVQNDMNEADVLKSIVRQAVRVTNDLSENVAIPFADLKEIQNKEWFVAQQ